MLELTRVLSEEDKDPFQLVDWEISDITIQNDQGKVIFDCPKVEFPANWTSLARNIVAHKYFRLSRNSDERETSVRQMIERVTSFIANAGVDAKYFDETAVTIFKDELAMLLLLQMGSFNSPVWFNVGVPGIPKPQGSACFINSVTDDMSSILGLAETEGMIFKEGSGSGVNLSPLRGSEEKIRGGGTASGPVSFMQGYDAFAQVILSGGRTRRAARMVILDIDHPDILKFINCKAEQEDIVKILALAGMPTHYAAENSAYDIVKHQSGNNSVMVTDEFMSKVREILHGYKDDETLDLRNRTDNSVAETVSVKSLFTAIAEAAHKCGDPGLQFYNTINNANTCSNDGEIVASNPCSEFVFLNNSACNLASLNLDKFRRGTRQFQFKIFKHAVRIFTIAQDILVDACSYPTKTIGDNSHKYRPLGLGFSNLGGLLMSWAIPYDSDEGRTLAASITSLMTGQAYITSAELAEQVGTFERYPDNRSAMEEVLEDQYTKTRHLGEDIAGIHKHALTAWKDVIATGFGKKKGKDEGTGFRNAQTTLIAPTGTISFMMDCATTGIEPDIGLKKTKAQVDGSTITYVNPNIENALNVLEYTPEETKHLLDYVNKNGHLEGTALRNEHLPIFDCSLPINDRMLSVDAHLNMVAAIQPFLSGAVSKTYNMDHDATVKDVALTLLKAWERKVKCITVYRAGSKMSEPLRVKEALGETGGLKPQRERLPDERDSKTHKFTIGGHEGYLTVGLYPDGRPGEIFLRVAQHGSTITGLLDAFATSCSIMLQYGVPLETLIAKYKGNKFIPSGITSNPDIPIAESVIDYVFKWIERKYLNGDIKAAATDGMVDLSADYCPDCGNPMQRTGTCLQCANCGSSQGVCS